MKKTINISQDKKVDIIFKYLFDGKSHINEEIFWNELSEEEVQELDMIKNESTLSLDELKISQ
jgi:hypothetical protein